MKGFLKWNGEWVISGTNARMRRCLRGQGILRQEPNCRPTGQETALASIPDDVLAGMSLAEIEKLEPAPETDFYMPFCGAPKRVRRWMNRDTGAEA